MLQRSLCSPLRCSSYIPKRLFPHPKLALRTLCPPQEQARLFHLKSPLYSPEKNDDATTSQPTDFVTSDEHQAPPETPEGSQGNEVESLKREIINLKDKYLRSVADSRNLQDRTKRDVASARDFAISRFAKDLVDTVDNLDRALATVPASALTPGTSEDEPAPNKDLVNLYDGLKMTEGIMMQTLANHGLERYDPAQKGEKFNPNLHEASFMAPQEDKEDGIVFTTIQKGFSLNGRIIRAAKVGVVKNR